MINSIKSAYMRGFTLLELMLVVALIGILSMVSWSYFSQQLFEAERGDGANALLRAAAQMQTCYAQQIPNSYENCVLENMGSGPCSDKNKDAGDTTIYSPQCKWHITNGTPTRNRYTLTASRTYTDEDGTVQTETLTLDSLGRKGGPWPR